MMTFKFNNIMFFIRSLKTPTASLIFSTTFVSVHRLPSLYQTTSSCINRQSPTITGIFIFLDFQASGMPFPHLICHFLLVLFDIRWKLSCRLPFSTFLIQICHVHIISSVHAVNVLLNLLTTNFHYQHLTILRPSTDLVVGPTVLSIVCVHYLSWLVCIVYNVKLSNVGGFEKRGHFALECICQ